MIDDLAQGGGAQGLPKLIADRICHRKCRNGELLRGMDHSTVIRIACGFWVIHT